MKRTKLLEATLREQPIVIVEIGDVFANSDWILGSSIIEDTKRKMLVKMKSKLHEQIELLEAGDLVFDIREV